jgi:nucleotide-binding universal stress UspA family protein
MFETVIVPLDGSPHAECALPYAIDEARRHQATIVLLHVIPRPEPCTSTVRRSGPVLWQGEWPFEDLDAVKRDAEAYLRDVVSRFALAPETTQCVAVGDPGVRVAAEVTRHEQPVVVILTGDSSRERRPPLSLVTHYLLIASAVPVLAIRQPPPSDSSRSPQRVANADTGVRLTRPGPATAPSQMPAVSLTPGW